MKDVRTILAAAVLGVSALALPSSLRADDFKKTQIDDIPREARDAIEDQTKDKKDLQVFTRHMDSGEDQYTAFYMDDGKRMEFRVDKNGKVTSPAHETREQPGDKDSDKDKKHDNDKDDKTASGHNDWQREPSPLKDFPKPAQDTLTKELQAAGAKDGDYFRLRKEGDDIYSMFYTPEGGQRQEVRVDKNGKVLGHFGEGANDNAQTAGARQPADTSANKTTPAPAPAQPAPKTGAATPAETTEAMVEVKADDLPKAVRESFNKQTLGAIGTQYRSWTRDGKQYYSVFYVPKGSREQMEYRVDASGNKLEDPHAAEAKK